jgi:hypothetical protein
LLRDDETFTLVNLGVRLLEGAVFGRVGVVDGGFNWDPGVLEVDLEPGFAIEDDEGRRGFEGGVSLESVEEETEVLALGERRLDGLAGP